MHGKLLNQANYGVADGRPEYLHGENSQREGRQVLQDLGRMHKQLLGLKQMLHFQKILEMWIQKY